MPGGGIPMGGIPMPGGGMAPGGAMPGGRIIMGAMPGGPCSTCRNGCVMLLVGIQYVQSPDVKWQSNVKDMMRL